MPATRVGPSIIDAVNETLNADSQQRERAPGAHYLPVVEAMVIGAIAGLSAIALLAGVNALGSVRISLSDRYPAALILPFIGLVGGLITGIVVMISPQVAGSGIPQVRALLNHINLRLDLKTAVLKLLSGTIALGCGLFMGREGPTVQVGASLAAQLSRWLPTTAEHRRQLIAAGAGAGLAAAFNAPIAGVTFVLEELLKEVTPSIISLSLVACFSAAAVEHFFGNARAHSLLHAHTTLVPLHWQDIIFYIVLGLLSAFVAVVFNNGVLLFLKLNEKTRLPVAARTAFAGLVTGILVSQLPTALHDYALARDIINTGTISPDMVPIVFTIFFLLVLIAYGSGAPGGLFAPSLMLGSGLGYLVGYAEVQLTGLPVLEQFALVGMGAFFAAAMRVPLTATVIVFEMSGNFSLIPPLMLSTVIASSCAEYLSKGSLYDMLMVWSGIHLHKAGSNEPAADLCVKDIQIRKDGSINCDATAKDASDYLHSIGRTACPVLDKDLLVGTITAAQLELAMSGSDQPGLVKTVMSKQPVIVGSYDRLQDVLLLFARYKFEWLPVADDYVFLGIITKEDVFAALFPQIPTASEVTR